MRPRCSFAHLGRPKESTMTHLTCGYTAATNNAADANYLYVNNSGADISPFHADIAVALLANGALPEELADLFTVAVFTNPDGSPRYVIDVA